EQFRDFVGEAWVPEDVSQFGGAGRDLFRFPMTDEATINGVTVTLLEHSGEFVKLVADLCRSCARRQIRQESRPALRRKARKGRCHAMTDNVRKQRYGLPCAASKLISIVACKELVAAVAGKCNGDVTARHGGNQESRDLRGVRKRFII